MKINGDIVGFATATSWKPKRAYRQTVETSLYIHPDHHKKGYGTHLLRQLIASVREKNVHSMIAGIIMPNIGSVKVHENAGFAKVGHISEAGFKNGKWHDVSYWQLVLR